MVFDKVARDGPMHVALQTVYKAFAEMMYPRYTPLLELWGIYEKIEGQMFHGLSRASKFGDYSTPILVQRPYGL